MTEIGWASLGVIPSFDGFESKLNAGTSKAMLLAGTSGGTRFGDAAGKSAGSRFGSVFSTAAKASLIGLAGAGALAVKFGSDSIEQASDLNESLNAVNVTYGKQARAVQKLGRQAAESLGLSNTEFNGLSVQFSAFADQVAGGNGRKTISVLDDLTTRGADFASVMNLEVNDALGLFQSGLAGETEPLRKYGIDLSAAKIEAFALSKGIVESSDQLTESAKVQARYALLMKETSKTQGDFANTSDSLANVQRRLDANIDNVQAKLGTALLPLMEDFSGFLLDEGIPAVEKFSGWFNKEGVPALKDFADFTKDEVFPVVEDLAGFLKDAGKFGGDAFKFFNDLPSEAKLAALGTLIGGGAALKFRGGGGGALGTAGSALGLAKPVPVFVTNPGFGTPGTPGSTVVGPDGKPTKRPRPRGGGVAGLLTLATLGPEILEELKWGVTSPKSPLTDFIHGAQTGGGGFTAKRKAAKTGFDTSGIGKDFQGIPVMAEQAVVKTNHIFERIKPPKPTLELLGVDRLFDQVARLGAEIDWVMRPREARLTLTKRYDEMGYETRGGLQEFGGGPVVDTQRRRAAGGF